MACPLLHMGGHNKRILRHFTEHSSGSGGTVGPVFVFSGNNY